MAAISLRRLSPKERERAFKSSYAKLDLGPYLDVVRELEGDVAYGIPLNGVSARAVKVRLNKAARALDLRLRWAKVPKNTAELIVELAP